MSFRVSDLWAGNLQAMWYIQDRGQISSVPEGLVSWDGIKIFFDSSTSDVQVGSHLLPILPVLTLILTLLTVPEAVCPLPCRTALPSECWPVMGMASRSSMGKGLRELTPPSLGLAITCTSSSTQPAPPSPTTFADLSL